MSTYRVSSSPHIHNRSETIHRIMWTVAVSLMPAGIAGVIIFGPAAFWTIVLSVGGALLAEIFIQSLTKKEIRIFDGSAFITGLLLAYTLPPVVPFWIPLAGSFVAIALGKQVFGGLGQNIFNPALVGRAFLMASWPHYVTTFTRPFAYDAITAATPLMALKESKPVADVSYFQLLMGNRGGCIGEVCILALIVGGAVLLGRRYISWHIPVSFIATVALGSWLYAGKGFANGDWVFAVLNGGLFLGAIFMATDYVTRPLTHTGQLIFGIGCGVITCVIRVWGGYPEGVCYAILMMNAATPLIDRFTRHRIYGAPRG